MCTTGYRAVPERVCVPQGIVQCQRGYVNHRVSCNTREGRYHAVSERVGVSHNGFTCCLVSAGVTMLCALEFTSTDSLQHVTHKV